MLDDPAKLVCAVCHGLAGFLSAHRSDGSWLFKDRALTGFSNEEETQATFAGSAPWLLEDRLRLAGARYDAAPAWTPHVVTDANLVTGQQWQSAESVATEVLERLNVAAYRRRAAGDRPTSRPRRRTATMSSPTRIHIPETDLDDLRARLGRARWPTPWPLAGRRAGPDPEELRPLVDYWKDGYDWRAAEAAINALPSGVRDIDGTAVYFLRYDGERADALPIVITHGWPSTFLEMTELARRLSAPSLYGGDPSDAFTVVVPALPGFAFSPQRPSLPPALPTHELWHRLMHDELGFARYAAHGGDLGAGISSLLAQAHPEAVVGVHLLAVADPVPSDADSVTAEEQAYLDAAARWFADSGGYEHEQMTRPLTLSYGLADSPIGLLAWIVEKYREWSDCDGVLANVFSDDFVLTQTSLYWLTNTISTSFRPYYEHASGLTPRVERVTVPTALAVFPKDLVQPPRSWAERTHNVTRYTRMPRGGHFAAYEQPQLLADDLADFFRSLR